MGDEAEVTGTTRGRVGRRREISEDYQRRGEPEGGWARRGVTSRSLRKGK